MKSWLNKLTGRSAGSFKIPIRAMNRTPYFVYLPDPSPPSDKELRATILAWWSAHASPEMAARGSQLFDGGMLIPIPLDLHAFPPCLTIRDAVAVDHPDVSKSLAAARSCLSLWASDTLSDPRVGLLFGRAGARAVAVAAQGVAVDATTAEVLNLDPALRESRRDLADEITIVPIKGSTPGTLSPRTAGAAKYGIPELQVCNVPRGIEYHITKLLMGAAYVFAKLAEVEADRKADHASHIVATSPITITGEGVGRAMGPAARFIFTQAQKVEVGFQFHPPTKPRPDIGVPDYVPFIDVISAGSFDGLVELLPPGQQSLSAGSRHWVEHLSLQLGLGSSATG